MGAAILNDGALKTRERLVTITYSLSLLIGGCAVILGTP